LINLITRYGQYKSASAAIQPGGKHVMVNVSRLLERKGQLDLLMAFAAFRRKVPAAVLLIAVKVITGRS
jgi:glycosyltransferase involved in cell wall biosynthesis